MNLRNVEENVAAIEVDHGPELLYELLRAYGLPKASISRLRSGTYDKAEGPDEHLWKGKVYFRTADSASDDLYGMIEAARSDDRVIREAPRFLIVENGDRVLARDQKTAATLDIQPSELVANAAFFLPWAGIEKTQLENLNIADVRAAEKMAELYDEITRHNEIEAEEQRHELNVFFSRLLFCFFAEDTGVFETASFTNAVGSLTHESGTDMGAFLDQLFAVLDAQPDKRRDVPEHLRHFGYVNGKLFSRRSSAPVFSAKARSVILECGTLDWSQINPDIFGSMMQAVVRRDERKKLGMHYTSVENIMKVVRPLFLDDFEEAFQGADTVRKLDRLLERLSKVQIFDPACGSGNFLVISYKELRSLEHRILQRIIELEPQRKGLFAISALKLENFYGIEVEDFPHEIAILSLWLAKHQMNGEFDELFGTDNPLIPLRDAGNIVCGNATRLDWRNVCDPERSETYVLGNPPYLGGKVQGAAQKADFADYFGTTKYARNLDYISLWFFKGAEYIKNAPSASLAFVSTNSICQGDHVGLMWPRVLATGARISFAHQSFRWSNQARGGAGVTCVVVGLTGESTAPENDLYLASGKRHVAGINPYLHASTSETIVFSRRSPIAEIPRPTLGSMPKDGGHLILSAAEREEIVEAAPDAARFIRRYGGSAELLNDTWRACLWIEDNEIDAAAGIPAIAQRLEAVRSFRSASAAASTRDLASVPHRFAQRAHKETTAIIIPRHSSERRTCIPMGFVGPETVISDAANGVYDAEPWLFALLQSAMHTAWVRAVGGALESRIRYSAFLVYTTFPIPELDDDARARLHKAGVGVLGAREQFPDQTLAELYDPDKTPNPLGEAHGRLDDTVDRLFRERGFASDEERLEMLFDMYEKRTLELDGESAHA